MTTSNSNLTLNGNSGSNTLTGGAGNDHINGRGGDDVLSGGAGNDEINGGAGNDILDGGSGSDELEGGSGNDTLIYKLAENNVKGTHDEYDGGSGTDTLELRFTRAEWMNATNQTVLQSYLNWASKTGSNCHWDDEFTFKFGNAQLEIEDIEKLVVKVDNQVINNAGNNIVFAHDDAIIISEDETGAQAINVLDNDNVNDLVKSLGLSTNLVNGTVSLIKPDVDNASTWYFNYTPDSHHYQYLNDGALAVETFKYNVTDANGDYGSATVSIKIRGVNDAAEITFETPKPLTEDTDVKVMSLPGFINPFDALISHGVIKITDKDDEETSLLRIDSQAGNLGKLLKIPTSEFDPITNKVIAVNCVYDFAVENNKVQYLASGEVKEEKFTIISIDGTSKDITFSIKGVNDAAVIGDPSNNQITEDKDFDTDGYITLTGNISISDVDEGENSFQIKYDSLTTNKGSFTIAEDGSYTYKVNNADLQILTSVDHPIDKFTIYAKDGTSKEISFTLNGVDEITNHAPVVEEFLHGQISYAGSANVTELINLDYSNPIIAAKAALGGDYDYKHVRTGQFSFSDLDLTDTFTITTRAAGPEGNLGTLTFDDYTKAKDSDGNIFDGEYIVKWTYTVKDSELDSLNAPASGSSSKDDVFIITINDGTANIDTKVILHLDGRNEIEFVDGLNSGNNVYEGTAGPNNPPPTDGNDVLYSGDGNDFLVSQSDNKVMYGENGNDGIYITKQDTVFFGGDGNDRIFFEFGVSNALFFGGKGDDTILYGSDLTTEGRKIYEWGGAGSDLFQLGGKSSKSIEWVMDFDMRKPIDGGDKIDLFIGGTNFNWGVSNTKLEKYFADNENPFLSEGAEYYDLLVNTSADTNNPNWLSVLNLVGTNGTEITLDGLIANRNLI